MTNNQPAAVEMVTLTDDQLRQVRAQLYQRCDIFKKGTNYVSDIIRNFVPQHIATSPDYELYVSKLVADMDFEEKMYFAAVPGVSNAGLDLAVFLQSPQVQRFAMELYEKSNVEINEAVNTIAVAKSVQMVFDTVISYGHITRELERREAVAMAMEQPEVTTPEPEPVTTDVTEVSGNENFDISDESESYK